MGEGVVGGIKGEEEIMLIDANVRLAESCFGPDEVGRYAISAAFVPGGAAGISCPLASCTFRASAKEAAALVAILKLAVWPDGILLSAGHIPDKLKSDE